MERLPVLKRLSTEANILRKYVVLILLVISEYNRVSKLYSRYDRCYMLKISSMFNISRLLNVGHLLQNPESAIQF